MERLTCQSCGAQIESHPQSEVFRCEYCGTEQRPLAAEEIPEAPLLAEPMPSEEPPASSQPDQSPPSHPSRKRLLDPDLAAFGSALFGIPKMMEGCSSILFVSIFVIFFGSIVAFSQCGRNERHKNRNITRTEEKLNEAARRIDQEASRLRALPDDIAGTSHIRHVRDGWNNELEYEKLSSTRFTLRSAGPDERMRTSDDIEKTLTVELKPR